MADAAPLQFDQVTKYYGNHRGVEDLSLTAEPGEVLGLLGPNGAGKTTAIRIALGFLRPTRGNASVLGFDAVRESVAVRRRTGYLPGDAALYGDRTGNELLRFTAAARHLDEMPLASEIADAVHAPMDRPVKKCSRGMRQKVALVLALAHDPELAILDEPTSGLDPLAQRAVLGLLRDASSRGKTILLSSHVLSEADQVCDRVAIFREGRLIALDRVENLRGRKYKEVSIAFEGDAPVLDGLDGFELIWQRGARITFRTRASASDLLARLATLSLTDVSITEPSLEDVFLDYYREGDRP